MQQAPHSTLNSWLEKLLYIVTGNFAKPGGMNTTNFAGLGEDPESLERPGAGSWASAYRWFGPVQCHCG